MARYLAQIYKDRHFFLVIPVGTLILPILIFLVSLNLSNSSIDIAVFGLVQDNDEYNIQYTNNLDEGKSLIKEGKVNYFYDSHSNILYAAKGTDQTAAKVLNDFDSTQTLNDTDDQIAKEKDINNIIFLLTLTVLFSSVTAVTVLNIDSFDTLKVVFMTPMTYLEYILAKMLIILVSFWIAIGAAILILVLLNIPLPATMFSIIAICTAGLLFYASIDFLVDLSTKNEELSELINKVKFNVILLITIFAYQDHFALIMPVSEGLKTLLLKGTFPIGHTLILLGSTTITCLVASRLFKHRMRT